jgi:hypothetical protein
MPRFVTKPYEVEANRVPPDAVMQTWVAKHYGGTVVEGGVRVREKDGDVIATIGEWIVNDEGEISVWRHAEFVAYHEPDEALARAEVSSDFDRMIWIDDLGREQPLYPPRDRPVTV